MAALLNWQRESAASLFERIQKEGEQSPSLSFKEFILSIKNNLSNILNTHSGTAQSARELGIMDLNDATSNATDMYKYIADLVKDCILTYEPRIINVNISPITNNEQPLTLFFYVEAVISYYEYQRVILFNMHLDNDHRYYLDMSNTV